MMIVTAWNNGAHHASGAGYGFQLTAEDRERFINKGWSSLVLELEGSPTQLQVNIKKVSFWRRQCGEVINQDIGVWFLGSGLAPWPKNYPPKFAMTQLMGNRFSITTIV